MRDYSKVSPQFWIGTTGKALRKAGIESQVVAMYLMTCPHANMLGLYYLPTLFLVHETGLSIEGASKGLAGAIEAGFCAYDGDSEVVWVFEMACYQVGGQLKPEDKRCAGVQNEYNVLPENPYLQAFFDKYETAFHLATRRAPAKEDRSPFKAPTKPGAGTRAGAGAGAGDARKPARGTLLPEDFKPDLEYARLELPDLDPEAEAAKFCDYWRAKTGANAAKADWPATWRNWIRRCSESGRYAKRLLTGAANPLNPHAHLVMR